MGSRRTHLTITVGALLILLSIVGSVAAHPSGGEAIGQREARLADAVPPLLQYQGRLTDPDTGEPVDDGSHTMVFRLYSTASGTSDLWTETKDVSVEDGVFSTTLGDVTALDPGLFNGQALWLGITVGADAEATPRQRILPVAYAMGLVPGAQISTTSSSAAFMVSNAGAGDAVQIDGTTTLNGDLSVSGSLSGGDHNHDGDDITSGTVDEPRIDPQIARDDEIMPMVLSNDGAGSGLDADTLDGQDSGDFAPTDHLHSGADITSGTVAEAYVDDQIARDAEVAASISSHAGDPDAHHLRYTDAEAWNAALDNDGPGSGLDADKLDGQDSSSFASEAHNHQGESWSGSGTGLTLESTTSYGLRAKSSSAVAGNAAVFGSIGEVGGYPGQEVGVRGEAADGYGVAGLSSTETGVYGFSSTGNGVWGTSSGSDASVLGYNSSAGAGVSGSSASGYGVVGDGGSGSDDYGGHFTGGAGLYAEGSGTVGILGKSTASTGYGVRGEQGDAYGILGRRSALGAPFYLTYGYGVYGVGRTGATFDYGGYFSGDYAGAYGLGSIGLYGVSDDNEGTNRGIYTPDNLYVGGKIDVVGAVDPIIGERFEVHPDGEYEVGDLLVIDPDSPYLVLSTEANDTKVIGVVGPSVDYQDGELMVVVLGYRGAKPDDPAPPSGVGEEGVVEETPTRSVARIKVDASYGAIKRGDLLTTSPTPGHAMKAEPVEVGGVEIHRPGTIIGKALESLDSGQGLIEVFVALQ